MPILFFTAFSCLLTHEMDAIRRHEWKIFPLLARLKNDERGYLIFTAVHIPLYVLFFWALSAGGTGIRQPFIAGLDVFCIIHLLLHVMLRKHPENQFNNWFSWLLIIGAAVASGSDLLVRW